MNIIEPLPDIELYVYKQELGRAISYLESYEL